MAGRGPAPKATKVRRNVDEKPVTTIHATPARQPALPQRMPNGKPWPAITRAWWREWGRSPLTTRWLATDWLELRDTAVLHGAYWSGETGLAAELRRRTARHGATTEDRARQRMVVAAAGAAPASKAPTATVSSSRERRALAAVPTG